MLQHQINHSLSYLSLMQCAYVSVTMASGSVVIDVLRQCDLNLMTFDKQPNERRTEVES